MNKKIRKSCERKKKYKSQAAAQGRCGVLHKKGIRVKPYKCPNCGGWHICRRNKMAVLDEIFKELEGARDG